MLASKAEEALRRLRESNDRGIDVETSGLDWKTRHIVGYVLTFGPRPDDSYYIPIRHAGGGNLEGPQQIPQTVDGWDGSLHPIELEICKGLDRPGLTIGHHLAFDLKFLYRASLRFKSNYEDTMINATLLNEWQSSFSLDACAKIAKVAAKKTTIYDYLISKFPELQATPKQAMGHYWRLAGDDPQAVEYAEGDGATTWQLRDWQRQRLAEQDLNRVHSVESRLIPVLAKMMTRGVKIDIERLNQIKILVEQRKQDAEQKLPDGFNPRSPSHVRGLMEQNGHTDWPLTPKGQPSFPETWLLSTPAGKTVVDVRKYSNILSSFIEPMLTTHLWNGRVHPEYNQLRGDEYGTVTGRLSSSNPNLQQVHKRNKELGRLYRSIFIPDEGKLWGSADYRQCEPVLLAYYSRSKVLLDGYRADPPINAHQAVATAANIDYDTGKRVNQTMITGGGKKVLTTKYGIPPNEVDRIWASYFEAMPEIKTLQRRAAHTMQTRGYVLSLLGRRARLNDPSKAYVAVNRLLQCGNADILKLKMVEIDDYLSSQGYPIDMLNNVHDAIDFQFDPDNQSVYEHCQKIMTSFGPDDAITLDVPLAVDAGEGPNWAIATYGEEK